MAHLFCEFFLMFEFRLNCSIHMDTTHAPAFANPKCPPVLSFLRSVIIVTPFNHIQQGINGTSGALEEPIFSGINHV